jgi:hypothetical protein
VAASRSDASTVLHVGHGATGGSKSMTENERRAQDVLTREDLVVRGFAVTGLIAMFLLMLLVMNS